MAVETLVEEAARLGIEALVLTDINNSMGMVDFVKACHAAWDSSHCRDRVPEWGPATSIRALPEIPMDSGS